MGGYLALGGVFASSVIGFSVWFRRSGRKLPDRIDYRDMTLLTVASHKTARLLSKDKVISPLRAPFTHLEGSGEPGEVEEAPAGSGLRRAVGTLLVCPYCIGMWTSAGFTAGLLVWPRLTRWIASVLTIFLGSELLQVGYKRVLDAR